VAINQNIEHKQQAGGSNGSAGSKESFRIPAPSISLSKGGRAIRGIGEKFAANPVTGTGSITVPIAVSPGVGGFGAQLSLSYDSHAQDCFLVKVYRDQVNATGSSWELPCGR
jgi:Salmonella virulence plasmid 65kDa B protein